MSRVLRAVLKLLRSPCWSSSSTVSVPPCTHARGVMLSVPFPQLLIDLLDEAGVFFLKARPTTHCLYQAASMQEDSPGDGKSINHGIIFPGRENV